MDFLSLLCDYIRNEIIRKQNYEYFHNKDIFFLFLVHFLLTTNPCYFLCLETKKVTKENSRLQRWPTQEAEGVQSLTAKFNRRRCEGKPNKK
jgi:hypothetical protein